MPGDEDQRRADAGVHQHPLEIQPAQFGHPNVEHDASPAQVAIAWELHKGYVSIPSTTKVSHLRSNFDAQQLQLTDENMADIEALDQRDRLIDPSFAPDWD